MDVKKRKKSIASPALKLNGRLYSLLISFMFNEGSNIIAGNGKAFKQLGH